MTDLDVFLERHTPAVREVFDALRALVREMMPDAASSSTCRIGSSPSDSAHPAVFA